MPPISSMSNGIRLVLHVQPRATRTELAGLHGGALKIRLAAPPVDGEANEELVRFLAKLLKVSPRAVSLMAGKSARRKIVEVAGVDYEIARQRLGLCS